jgi:hypothetical protein
MLFYLNIEPAAPKVRQSLIYAPDLPSQGGCMLTRSTVRPATPHSRQDTRMCHTKRWQGFR